MPLINGIKAVGFIVRRPLAVFERRGVVEIGGWI
jgi:hypothetical protein